MASIDGTTSSEGRSLASLLNAADDILVDVIREDGLVIAINREQRRMLGLDPGIDTFDMNDLYDPEAVRAISDLFAQSVPEGFRTTLDLCMIGRAGRPLPALASCTSLLVDGRLAFRFSKNLLGSLSDRLNEAQQSNDFLRRLIDTAFEGHWCIEFLEPIDTSKGREQIIDEVFENASIWQVANPAMARLYDLPQGELIRAEDVRLYWPRTPENEAFVGQIVDAGYVIDRAISHDKRHDGAWIYLENDVRADIEGGYLKRIWGNCRDVSAHRSADHGKINAVAIEKVLDALPEPVFLINDSTGAPTFANLAFHRMFEAVEEVASSVHACSDRKTVELKGAGGGRALFSYTRTSVVDVAKEGMALITLRKKRSGTKQGLSF